eukprot:gene18390-24861_t
MQQLSRTRFPTSSRSSCRATLNSASRPRQTRVHVASAETFTLSDEQVKQFHKDGFLVLEKFASQEEVASLRSRAGELVDSFDPTSVKSIFSTTNQRELTDNYFYESAGNISFFFEVAGILKSLGYKRPLPVQSMYIFKQPKIGGEVVPHQDSTFIYTQPLSCVGLWWALEDADKHNGCLWAQPGIHKDGLQRRFYVEDGKVTFDKDALKPDMSNFVPLECPAGTLVLLHGENVHGSSENTSSISRHSYSMHVVEGTDEYKWPQENWAHRSPEDAWEPMGKTRVAALYGWAQVAWDPDLCQTVASTLLKIRKSCSTAMNVERSNERRIATLLQVWRPFSKTSVKALLRKLQGDTE